MPFAFQSLGTFCVAILVPLQKGEKERSERESTVNKMDDLLTS